MEQIQWNDSYNVGVARFDHQHRQLVDMINQLSSSPTVDVQSEIISELLSQLTKYASDHFEAEEVLLQEHGFPSLSGHKESHRLFRQKIAGFCVDSMQYKQGVPAELLEYMRDWLINHILGTDMEYSTFLNERGVD